MKERKIYEERREISTPKTQEVQSTTVRKNESNFKPTTQVAKNKTQQPTTEKNTAQDTELKVVTIQTMGSLKVAAELNSQIIYPLIDTGASVTCVNDTLVGHLKIYPVRGVQLKTADNSKLKLLGKVTAKVIFKKAPLMIDMLVVQGLAEDLIIGNDFHSKYSLQVSFQNNTITLTDAVFGPIEIPFKNSKILKTIQADSSENNINKIQIEEKPKIPQLLVSKEIKIEPGQYSIVKCYIDEEIQESLGIFEPHKKNLMQNQLAFPNTLLQIEGPLNVTVVNASRRPHTLFKGTSLGNIEGVREIQNVDEINQRIARAECITEDSSTQEKKDGKFDINPNLEDPQKQRLLDLFDKYKSCFAWGISQIGRTTITEQQIKLTSDVPVHSRPYKVSHKEREILRKIIQEMLDYNIIRESRSQYASPVILVKKKCGDWRLCVDYRKLNELIVPERTPLPLISDIFSYLDGSTYFSTLDLLSGFFQIPIKEEDKHKTAIITADGLYEFNVTSMGLKHSPATFQRVMDQLLAGLKWNSVLVYLDDIVVLSRNFDEQVERLEVVLSRLQEANMTLKPTKCAFAYQKVHLLGHIISKEGIQPDPMKIEAIQKFPKLKKVKDVRSFLGLSGYYRRFVKNYADIARPLTNLTKKNAKFEWTEEHEQAFESLKQALTSAPVLAHFRDDYPTEVHSDASDLGVGAVLVQRSPDGGEHPIAYLSKRLSDQQTKWTTTEKECFAIVSAVKAFRQYIWGRKVDIITDHAALCWLLSTTTHTGRLARWCLLLQDTDFVIKHKNGALHNAPDCLSRNPVFDPDDPNNEDSLDIPVYHLEIEEIAQMQRSDPELLELISAFDNPEQASAKVRKQTRSYVLDNAILYKKSYSPKEQTKLLVVPQCLQAELLIGFHDDPISGGHLGVAKTISKMKGKYFWKNMLKDVELYIRTCTSCMKRKSPTQAPQGLLEPIKVTGPFDHMVIDILGPFPKSEKGYTNIVVATDLLTKYVVAKPLYTATAKEIAEFIVQDIICVFGVVSIIQSDRGQVFRSNLVVELVKAVGAKSNFSTSYRPQSQGLTERFNGTLATMLSMYTSTDQKDWDKYIKSSCFAFNSSIQDTTKCSPHLLVFGRDPVLPVDLALQDALDINPETKDWIEILQNTRQKAKAAIEAAQLRQKARYDIGRRHVEYKVGQQVLLYSPARKVKRCFKLDGHYLGPYTIVEKRSDLNYVIEIPHKTGSSRETVHIQRLKPFYSTEKFKND